MREFDPKCERHYPLMTVTAVEPGCTTEWQFVDQQTGEVTRVTTTDDPAADEAALVREAVRVVQNAWAAYADREHTVGTVATDGLTR